MQFFCLTFFSPPIFSRLFSAGGPGVFCGGEKRVASRPVKGDDYSVIFVKDSRAEEGEKKEPEGERLRRHFPLQFRRWRNKNKNWAKFVYLHAVFGRITWITTSDMTFLPSISLAMEFSTLLLLLACLLFTVTVIEGKSNYAHADLECYMGRNPVGYRPNVLNVCHRYRFHQTPQCLKFTQGSVVTRDCDPSFLCEVSFVTVSYNSWNTFSYYAVICLLLQSQENISGMSVKKYSNLKSFHFNFLSNFWRMYAYCNKFYSFFVFVQFEYLTLTI